MAPDGRSSDVRGCEMQMASPPAVRGRMLRVGWRGALGSTLAMRLGDRQNWVGASKGVPSRGGVDRSAGLSDPRCNWSGLKR